MSVFGGRGGSQHRWAGGGGSLTVLKQEVIFTNEFIHFRCWLCECVCVCVFGWLGREASRFHSQFRGCIQARQPRQGIDEDKMEDKNTGANNPLLHPFTPCISLCLSRLSPILERVEPPLIPLPPRGGGCEGMSVCILT